MYTTTHILNIKIWLNMATELKVVPLMNFGRTDRNLVELLFMHLLFCFKNIHITNSWWILFKKTETKTKQNKEKKKLEEDKKKSHRNVCWIIMNTWNHFHSNWWNCQIKKRLIAKFNTTFGNAGNKFPKTWCRSIAWRKKWLNTQFPTTIQKKHLLFQVTTGRAMITSLICYHCNFIV